MHHQRSPRCLGAAPLAAALLLRSPAEAALGGVTPAPDTLQVFAPRQRGRARPRRGSPPAAGLGSRAQGVAVSAVAEEMSRLKVPVSVSGNPRPEQLSALRDALTEPVGIVDRGALFGAPAYRRPR